jgi:hypothetical protein
MGWFQGAWVKWLAAAAGLLTVSCAGAIGAGAAVVVVGAGVVGFTCYDRVSVTVTDRLTGTKLCDATVTFLEKDSKIEATSCYQAALAKGKYKLHVERRGLAPYEEPVEVTDEGKCGQTVQTMYVALDRLNAPATSMLGVRAPEQTLAPVNGTVVAPSTSAATNPPVPAALATSAAPSSAPPAASAAPPAATAPRASVPAPAKSGTTAFPDTP